MLRECSLFRADTAFGCLDLNTGEHGDALTHHVGGDLDRAVTYQVTTADTQARMERPALAHHHITRLQLQGVAVLLRDPFGADSPAGPNVISEQAG